MSHCWTVCFGSGVTAAVEGAVVDVVLFFSFLLPFSERAEAEANDVRSFFLSCIGNLVISGQLFSQGNT